MKESYKKGDSDSILALSLAGDIARCRLKRRQGYRWAGRLSFEKRKIRTPTLLMEEGNTAVSKRHACRKSPESRWFRNANSNPKSF
jgi:hypothetical protein